MKNTARPQRYLQAHGYQGTIIPINPNRDEVLGLQAWPDLGSAPGPIDHAFIMVPAPLVPKIIEDCARTGITVATIYSDGFAEAGDKGLRRQREILAIAIQKGIRLIGPNSMGIINCRTPTPITVNAALDAPELIPGSLSVISQSGSILGTLISRGQASGIGFSKLVSVGNEADLGVAEIGNLLVDDPETKTILLFMESIRDPDKLADMARRAFDIGKPVIVYKLGRSNAGRALAISHSGAIAGSDEAATAYFRHHSMIRVDMLETSFEIATLVTGRVPTSGRRVAVLTTTGGGGAMVVDRLDSLGVDVITPPVKLVKQLKPKGIHLGNAPLVDLTMVGAKKEIYDMALEALLASKECDAVVAVVGSSAQFQPEIAVEPILAARKSNKPLAVFLVPQADRSLEMLAKAGIAVFRTPESCAEAVRAFLDWSPPQPPPPTVNQNLDNVRTALSHVNGPVLDEIQSRTVFEAIGIQVAPAQLLEAYDDNLHVEFPVAAKLVSPNLAHKDEVGGVVLDITDKIQLKTAVQQLRKQANQLQPGIIVTGIIVQHMEKGVAEVLIGYKDNPETGPIVICRLGGSFSEHYQDVAIRLAPVSLTTAHAMIKEAFDHVNVRGGGFQEVVNCAALARAIASLSNLAGIGNGEIAEAEINPLIVKEIGDDVVAVDGLIVLQKG